ncbi:DUF423 domain-containing protein [Xylophilus sp.]|uniref:DUF423 domain-containing protein n=1 Tax=Xylophilus sp. TaxID=2653893 RepID=UPI0013BA5CAA|nr:DUF423 domain-containing protein [Xylophilus sp.]KAF1047398.1 MAG: hypothetical protein GAK38_01917 [Xylophilus sp.]
MPASSYPWIVLAALAGASGVGCGAYAAHGLGFIASPEAREAARLSLQSATQYQLLHALALLGVGLWAAMRPGGRWLLAAGLLFLAGILLFSGLIYLQTFTGFAGLRRFVPWGGMSFILGWLALGAAAVRTVP